MKHPFECSLRVLGQQAPGQNAKTMMQVNPWMLQNTLIWLNKVVSDSFNKSSATGRQVCCRYHYNGRLLNTNFNLARLANDRLAIQIIWFRYLGPQFTKRTDVLPPNLVTSWSCEIGCYNVRIALTFDGHLGSIPNEVFRFQRAW